MTNEKDTIIDAEFTETDGETDRQTEDADQSLVVPKRPNKPANPNNQKDTSTKRQYSRIIAYSLVAFTVLALIALYIRGMYIAG